MIEASSAAVDSSEDAVWVESAADVASAFAADFVSVSRSFFKDSTNTMNASRKRRAASSLPLDDAEEVAAEPSAFVEAEETPPVEIMTIWPPSLLRGNGRAVAVPLLRPELLLDTLVPEDGSEVPRLPVRPFPYCSFTSARSAIDETPNPLVMPDAVVPDRDDASKPGHDVCALSILLRDWRPLFAD